jgi:hypothetical protein
MSNVDEMIQTEAQQQTGTPLDAEAVIAIRETRTAIDAIKENRREDAVAAIERATGKIDILLARHPNAALLPVDQQVAVFDTAPDNIDDIRDIGAAADGAVQLGDFPHARGLLYGLMSEVRIHTVNLPLASYPTALSTAARLMEQKRNDDAEAVLNTALGTLVLTDRIIPIPMLVARRELEQAQAERDKNKGAALHSVESARKELKLAQELGYAIGDPDYQALDDQLSDLHKQLKGNADTNSVFSKIRERLASLLKRQSQREYAQSGRREHAHPETEKKAA